YAPAQLALGASLLDGGDAKGALRALGAAEPRDRCVGAWVLLARARLANGDAKGAIEAARKEAAVRGPDGLLEPASRPFHDRMTAQALAIEGLAELALHHLPKAARLLFFAARDGDPAAQDRLRSEPRLRPALKQLARDRSLTAEER